MFPCVNGIYLKDGKVLSLKRGVEPFKGCWSLVGGHVDENETVKEALKREFKEETNQDVTIGELIDGRLEETFDRIKIILTFEVTSASGKIKLSKESEEYGWFNKIPPNSVYNYEQILRKIKQSPQFNRRTKNELR